MSPFVLVFALVSPPPQARPYEGVTEVVAPDPASRSLPTPAPTPPRDTRPEPEPELDDSRSQTWTVGAFIDAGYVFNSNFPDNHVYRGAVTSPRTEEITVNLGAAYLLHPATPEEPWHLQLALQAGPAVDALYAPEPVPGEDVGRFAGAEVWKHLGLASVGGMIPKSRTELDVGLMNSPIGIGSFWPTDNWNVSNTWAANGTPYYLLGGRIVQPLPAGFGLQVWVVNGWQTAADVNDVPSYVAAVTWDHEHWSVSQVVMFGPEDLLDEDPEYWRVHSDTKATWNTRRLGVAVIWDAGRETVQLPPESGLPPRDEVALWTGGALFVRGRPHDGEKVYVDLSARPDAWWDRDGRIYGTQGWLIGATGTLTVGLWEYLRVRLEYRYDHATDEEGFFYRDDAITDDASSLSQEQHTVFLSLLGMFEHRFATKRERPSS